MRVLLLALGLPLVEIALFVLVGRQIGVLPVLGLVVLAAVAGVALMKSTGPATARRVQAAMSGRENPLAAAGGAAFRMVAGLLLVAPGFFTDAVALLLLLPPVQRMLIARVASKGTIRMSASSAVIDGEAVEIEIPPRAAAGDEPGLPPSGWTRH